MISAAPASNRYVNWPYNWFGFFTDGKCTNCFPVCSKDLPLLNDFADPIWSPDDRPRLIDYLQTAGAPIVVAMHPSKTRCLLCKKELCAIDYRWDGTWVWPQNLVHYVEAHSVRLPDRMVAHIRGSGYGSPQKVEAVSLEAIPWPSRSKKSSPIGISVLSGVFAAALAWMIASWVMEWRAEKFHNTREIVYSSHPPEKSRLPLFLGLGAYAITFAIVFRRLHGRIPRDPFCGR